MFERLAVMSQGKVVPMAMFSTAAKVPDPQLPAG